MVIKMTKWIDVEIKEPKEVPLIDEVTLIAHERETGYKAVVNKMNMETICVIPKKYQLVQHQHVLDEIQKLDNYVIRKMELMSNGQMLMVELTEREPKKIELLPEDFIEVGARIFNDYSKNAGLSVQAYGTRLACTNGMIAPTFGTKIPIQAFGTAEFSKEIQMHLDDAFKIWYAEDVNQLFKRATEVEVSIKDILEDHSFLPNKHMDEVISKLEDKENLYKIWNTYTQVITHQIAPKTKDINTIGLQKRANKILTIGIEH